ncbi:VanZ family protein [Sulfuricurvum sp.]|uniref:VanZ family protein n=1 Tax=Sulfuricurvum sp. TaxID=2025608 RepID=UPI002602F8B9|nr:VanZ family protein [Sulfuricurvum sp.]MDD2267132.1 VanZ family protein [Sulfuricurvum sp.]MDD2784839.1 VanZ family protein [Sulfuricurvum sp.]
MIVKIIFFTALILISTLAFLPDYSGLPPVVSLSDKLNHAAAFTVLILLYKFAFPHSTQRIVVSLLLYAVFIEVVQAFLPTREASLEDIFADSTGLVLGVLLFTWMNKKRPETGRESVD